MKTSLIKRSIQKTPRFTKDIKKLSQNIQENAFTVSQKLAEDVFHSELNILHLTGFKGIYRIVIMKDYRMIFSFDIESLYLLRIGHRKEIYRKLEF